jgi:hypothetical protein
VNFSIGLISCSVMEGVSRHTPDVKRHFIIAHDFLRAIVRRMETASQRQAAYETKLRREGWKRISLWLAPADAELLKRLAKTSGQSFQEELREALRDQADALLLDREMVERVADQLATGATK